MLFHMYYNYNRKFYLCHLVCFVVHLMGHQCYYHFHLHNHYNYLLNKYYGISDFKIFEEPTKEDIEVELKRLNKIKQNEKKSKKFYKRLLK